jgi:hypothetical protein
MIFRNILRVIFVTFLMVLHDFGVRSSGLTTIGEIK